MPDNYIKRSDALMAIQECFDKELEFSYDNAQSCMNRIKVIPAADVKPVRHGRWIDAYPKKEQNPIFNYGTCSVCGFEQSISNKLNFCPNCGTKMDAKPPKEKEND